MIALINPTKGDKFLMQALLFLSFVFLVYFLLRFIINTLIDARKNKPNTPDPQQPDSQTMVRCAYCGVHLPQSEAYFDGQHTFCSEGHMRLGPKTQDIGGDSNTIMNNDDGD